MNNVLCLFHRIILAMMTEWFARCLILFCSLVNLFVFQKVSYSLFKNVVPITKRTLSTNFFFRFSFSLSFDEVLGIQFVSVLTTERKTERRATIQFQPSNICFQFEMCLFFVFFVEYSLFSTPRFTTCVCSSTC